MVGLDGTRDTGGCIDARTTTLCREREAGHRISRHGVTVITPRVLILTGSGDGSSLWRVWQPAAELERQGYIVHWAPKDADNDALIARIAVYQYNIIVLARVTWRVTDLDKAQYFIEMLHRLGMMVVYECDDDMFLHVQDHLRDFVDAERLASAQMAIHTVKLCDGITVSTPRLQTVIEYVTGGSVPVACVPNLLDLNWWESVQRQAQRLLPPLVIGWAGAKRQDADLAPMAEAWVRVARRFPQINFLVQGWCPEVVRDAVPAQRLHTLPFLAMEHYPAGLVNVDIGCASVADTPFNACKSVIKALEYGASGAAVVATSALYHSIIRHNDTGLIANTADEWTDALSHLVEDRQHAKLLTRRLRRRIVTEHNLQRHADRWIVAWSWLLEQRERRAA